MSYASNFLESNSTKETMTEFSKEVIPLKKERGLINTNNKPQTNLFDHLETLTSTIEAPDHPQSYNFSIQLNKGEKVTISIKKGKIETTGLVSTHSTDGDNKSLYDIIKLLQEKLDDFSQINNEINTKNQELLIKISQMSESLKKEREAKKLMLIHQIEKSISRTYLFTVSFLGLLTAFSALSFLFGYLPKPIDTALFWSSLAGTIGFLIDGRKRGKLNG